MYTVWFNMLPGDARSTVDLDLIPDPRATQLWDERRLAGQFFAENDGFVFGQVAYDVYYLYGPGAEWNLKPAPLVSLGYTILAKKGQLRDDIQKLLSP